MSRRHSLPAEVYALVDQTPGAVLLECAQPGKTTVPAESFSRIFVDPVRVYAPTAADGLTELFSAVERAVAAGQFAAGFFTYECGACFEPSAGVLNAQAPDGRPLAWIGIYDRCFRFDHETGTFVDGAPAGLSAFHDVAERSRGDSHLRAKLNTSEEDYARSIAAIHEWIRAGDVYQLNFTVDYDVALRGSVAALYESLRTRQPVEYGAFVHWKRERKILSFSPELFFSVDELAGERRITTRPMKGTAARGRTTREDHERAEWLRTDEKNRSENVMIVDLLRNDLGRIANFGSVRTADLFTLERYPTLWQMTSTVTAELRADAGFDEIFRALFPCGSITGAPKVRAMQLIGELEQRPRGVYTGAIGFFSRARTVFNVAIRTLELENGNGVMGVGSGIVIDSDSASEFSECQLKAEFVTGARHQSAKRITPADKFMLIETMLWRDGFPLLELHLDRLEDSAQYFDFPMDRTAIRQQIAALATAFPNHSAQKVCLLLEEQGALHLSHEPLPQVDPDRVGRVRIAEERTDSGDCWLFHKTTNRALYALAIGAAREAGYDDLLFLNERGEVTEGAISNVFVEKDGRWFTPPVECGLLAGVYRRHLLDTRENIVERALTLDDLRCVDAVYLTNALRGIRKITVEW